MNSKKSLLTSVALSSLILASGCSGMYASHAGTQVALGQCHGVNACEGKGDCSSKTHDCAGENSCEGKGWIKMSMADCEKIKDSAWTAIPKDIKHKG